MTLYEVLMINVSHNVKTHRTIRTLLTHALKQLLVFSMLLYLVHVENDWLVFSKCIVANTASPLQTGVLYCTSGMHLLSVLV
jgi:hypothetical protein